MELKTFKMKFIPKYLKAIICIQMLFLIVNVSAQNPPFWNDIQAFKKQDSIAMPVHYKTLFIGSSSFTKWITLEQDLLEYATLNRAFGGSTLLDVIRYRAAIIEKYNPERIVIYCGENDIASSDAVTGITVLERFRILYQHIREKFPTTEIYFISLKPCPLRWEMRQRMLDANNRIANFCKNQQHTYFINIWNQMLKNSKPNPSLFIEDSLHMNSKGYDIWMKKIKKKVKIN